MIPYTTGFTNGNILQNNVFFFQYRINCIIMQLKDIWEMISMENKRIKFQYFRIMEYEGNKKRPYDFRILLNRIQPLNLAERIKIVSDTKARLENTMLLDHINANFLAMRFMKLSEYALPYVSNENGPSKDIELGEDEYIGKDVNVIYDTSTYTFLIQKNRGSLSINALQKYFNAFYVPQGNSHLELEPIYNPINPQRLHGTKYKKIEIKFANLRKAKIRDVRNFKEVINYFNKFEGVNATISISLGYSKDESLEHGIINSSIEEAKNNKDLIAGLKLKYTDEEDISQVYDLFDNILYEIINYTLKPRTTIGFEYVTTRMGEEFQKRLPILYKALNMR